MEVYLSLAEVAHHADDVVQDRFSSVDWAMEDQYSHEVRHIARECDEEMAHFAPEAEFGEYNDDPYECLGKRAATRLRSTSI